MAVTTIMENTFLTVPAFQFIRGPVACLLIHGFGDTASLMEPMGSFLSGRGISATGITLPGHGTSLEDFANVSNERLLAAVEAEYTKLKQTFEAVVVVGFSMGGLLALHLATMRDVEGIVTICAPSFPRGGRAGEKAIKFVAKLGAPLGTRFPKFGLTSLSDKTLSHHLNGYKSYPSRSVLRLVELMESTRTVVRRVNAPILIVQSRRDDVIWKDSAQYIFDSVKSEEKRLLFLENGRHKAPIDSDRHLLFEEVGKFCLSRSKQSSFAVEDQ